MKKEDFLNLKFQFQDIKFDFNIPLEESVKKLKSLIKDYLNTKVNLDKYFKDISTLSKISEENIILSKSTPPTIIYNEEYDNLSVSKAGFQDNEELLVSIRNSNINNNEDMEKTNKENNDLNENKIDFSKYSVQLKFIPGDNSCLFNAVNYAINQCLTEPNILRELIAVEIQSNPELYNEAVLEADPMDYCEWIMRDNSWGGGIELSILSKCFRLRIDVVDILNNTIEMIGDVRKYF